MKMNLLTIVQKILTSMDSDEVNSIDDTIESQQVAEIVQDTYFYLINDGNWSFLDTIISLESLSDISRPTSLRIPTAIKQAKELKYDVSLSTDVNKKIKSLIYLDENDFITHCYERNTSNDNVVEVQTATGVPIFVFNDREPSYWTTFNDEIVVLDSYISTEESTVQGNKSIVLAEKEPVFSMTNNFIPDLPVNYFPTFLSECKRASHIYLKQQISQVDELRARRGVNKLRHFGNKMKQRKRKPTYGRT